MFITEFTTARHLSPFCARSFQSMIHPVSHQNPICTCPSPTRATRLGHLILNIRWGVKCKVIPLQARCGPDGVGTGIALLFHDRGTRRGWVVRSTPRPHFNPGKDPVPIVQEAGWAPGPVWTGGKSRPHRDSIPVRPARSQSLYRLSYPADVGSIDHNSPFYVVYSTPLLPRLS